jgi:DNA-binding Lrp family transcriptional regulator
MANKNSNVPYDQIPHIVINHPATTPEHESIMRALFKVLKDKPSTIYSNEALSLASRVPERTLRRRLIELEQWGFIKRFGASYNRRFSLGLLFNTPATVAGSKLNAPAKTAMTPAKIAPNPGHGGRDTNPFTKHSTNEDLSFSSLNHFETKELELCIERNVPLSSEFKYLQPLLDKALINEKNKTVI